ncbi:MAG: LamG-like jellyroll fold domain-containing protein [Kiritimatiellales bacterium]
MKTSKNPGKILFYTCAFILLFQGAVHGAIQQEFWVAPSGSDLNAGTLAAPFRTIDKARLAVRTNLPGMTGDIVVYLRAGDYYIPSGVTFNNSDSGTNGFKVIYKNGDALGSARIISAARLSGWSADPVDVNVWTKNVGANRTINSIFEGENQGIVARYPNKNVTTNFPSSLGDYLIAESGGFTNLQYASGDLNPAAWTAMSDPKLCIWGASGVQDWGVNIWSISNTDSANRMIYSTVSNTYAAASADRYYVQGVLEFLDAPGEFYYDKISGLLKYRAFSGLNPGNNVIVPSSASVVFRVQGSAIGNLVRNIRFEGLYFWGSPTYGIYLTHTENIEIINCHFKFSGREAIIMKDDNQNNLVSGCWIEHSGYGGIYIFNALDRTTNAANKSYGHVIENCKINDLTDVTCSATENGGVNIWNANNCTVSHCEIFNGARYAISLRGHYSTESVPYDNGRHYSISNVFENLTIYNVGSDSGDMGAIHAAAVNPTGSPYINYWRNIEVDDLAAASTMHDIAPNGIFLDHANSCENQSFENIRIRNTQGLPYRDNNNPVQTFNNCSWIDGFNESLMSTSMGLTSNFPAFSEGPFLPLAAPPATTLAYWQLDEASGAWILQDAIGSNDLTLSVSATQIAPSSAITNIPLPDLGPFNIGDAQDNPAALSSSHAARSVYDATFDMRSSLWTLEGWFRHSAQTSAEVLAGTRNSSAGYKGWSLTMTNGALRLLASPASGADVSITTPSRYDDGVWRHTAVQWDPAAGSNGWMRIYVDGTLAAEGAGAGDLGNTDSTKRFALGAQIATDGTVTSAWNGDLDEFRFSGTLLVPADFLCAVPLATTTVAYWQMDDATGSSFMQDAVGSHNLAMGVNITQTEPSSSVTNVPNPDTSRFRIGDPKTNPVAFNNSYGGQELYDATFDMRTTPWTLEGWIRNSSTNTQLIAATRNGSSGYKGWDLSMIAGKLRVLASSDITSSSTSFTTTALYNDGVWHHVAVRWDPNTGATGWMKLYVDGSMVKEGAGVGDLGNANSTKRFALGCQMMVDGTALSPWLGDLDEFRFSSTLLEPTNFLNVATLPLAVTMNQAAGQTDPASAEPVNFTVEFSKPVTDFATGDVTISGTATGTITAAVSGSGTSYNVAVTGMRASGTVIATIETNKAHSATGQSNEASTSTDNTVTFNYTPPVPSTTFAYWQFDEATSSTVLQDAIGTNKLTLGVRAVTTTPFKAKVPRPDAGPFITGDPKTNPAALAGSYGARPVYDAAFDMSSSPWTLEGWFRNSPTNILQVIAATRNSPSWKGWDLRMTATGTIQLYSAVASNASSISVTTAGRYDDGVWHHIAIQWDPTNGVLGKMWIYMDGTMVTNKAGLGNFGGTNTLRFAIGGQFPTTGVVASPWKGDLDEFRFSTAVLNPTNFLYAAETAPKTLAYWQLDEATGATVLQDAVSSNNLTRSVIAENVLPYSAIIQNPDAGPFSIGDPKTNSAALNCSRGGLTYYDEKFDMRAVPWTLEGWFRNPTQTVAGVLAATRNASAAWKGWDLTMLSNGTLRVLVSADITTNGSTITTAGRYDDGGWHHVALLWDPDTGTRGWVQLYIDGTLVKEGIGAGDLGNTNSMKCFAIGAQITAGGVASSPWLGDLDEFRLSNALLSPTNFLRAMNAPLSPVTVTINQASGQADPANREPLNFTAVFSEPVADFVTGDVTISGTASGAKTATVSGSGTSYNVAVTGMSGSGTVIATIDVNKAHGALGNTNAASTSTDNTVAFNYTAGVVLDISATYTNGQTFIQWNELAANTQNFKVYMHTSPITSNNFSQAQLVEQRIEPHSANDWYEDTNECPLTADAPRGWILQGGGAAAGRTGGLFVHTVVPTDPAQAYFAVLADNQSETNIMAGQNSLTSSVAMAVAPISAIWQLGAPAANSPPATGKPLAMYLHSHQSRPTGSLTYLIFGDKTMGWREGLPFKFKVSVLSNAVKVEPYNRIWINRKLGAGESLSSYDLTYKNIETMHYGASDKIYDPVERYNGTVVNYTERLYLKILDWVEQTYQTDANKVYAYGDSMGTGILRLALQNPDRFACVDLLVPFVDWSYVNGTESNAKRMLAASGPMTMMTSDGVALSNRMNLVEQVQNTTHNLPHITIRVGRQDGSVYWARKPVFMEAMQTNRHGLIAGWDNGDHGSAMRTANIAGFPNHNDYTYAGSHFARNKSYPAFSRFSMNQNPGNGDKTNGDIVGFINRGLEWSNIVDQASSYSVKVQVTHPDVVYPVTVNVTPRNLQNLQLTPGQALRAQNRNSAGTVVEEKNITVDSAGLATYGAFTIDSAQGNTLSIDPVVYYTLTVNSGNGSGSYIDGALVEIYADSPIEGQVFDKWTGDTQGVASVTSANTTVTMPAQAINLTATYTDITYALTVTSGNNSGSYTNGQQVAIEATAIGGKTFVVWTGDTVVLADSNSASTTVTMPAQAVSLTATYVDTTYALTVTSGTGGGSYTNGHQIAIVADAPASGYAFDQWAGSTQFVASASSASTTITMPAQAIAVTATYIATEQYTATGTPYSWLDLYGLTNHVADAALDQDNDGLLTWQEYIAGTVPTNASSCFKAVQSTRNIVTWIAQSNRVYSVYWSTNLARGFAALNTNILYPQSSYTNTTPDSRVNHYQIKVRLP